MSEDIRFSTTLLDQLAAKIENRLSSDPSTDLLGPDLSKLVARIPSSEQVTPGALVRLSLLNDALCVAERVIRKDGVVSDAELMYVEPLVRETHKYLSRVRSFYRETVDLDQQGLRHFLEQHQNDTQQFGGNCRSTAWNGLGLCERASKWTSDSYFVDQYRDVVSRTIDELFESVGSGTREDRQEVLRELARLLPKDQVTRDPREVAYCAPDSPEVFHAVSHGPEVFELDPYDVSRIHEDARLAFSRLLDRAPEAAFGKMLLIKGESGAGKTHLMRAFRNQVHGESLGFVGYMQMSTRANNYARYVLANLIESWERPYWGESIPDPAIICLSDSVASALLDEQLNALRDPSLADRDLHELVNRTADQLLTNSAYAKVNVDVLRMMLYLQRREPARRARVLKVLRCEQITAYDRAFLGDVVPFEGEEGPARMLTELARLVNVQGGALVLLIDQLEDVFHLDHAAERFRSTMDTLRSITDKIPTAVVVVACLEDFYVQLRPALSQTLLDRLEKDPEPIRLTAGRSPVEIEELIGRRLDHLFERKSTQVRDEDPLYPFTSQDLQAQVNQRTRDILDWCRTHHESCIAANRVVRVVDVTIARPLPPDDIEREARELAQSWNDVRVAAPAPPEAEQELVELLTWAFDNVEREHDGGLSTAVERSGTWVDVTLPWGKVCAGLCEKTSRGGGLGTQIEALQGRARDRGAIPVALRSYEYPPPGKTKITEQLKSLLQAGGRRVVVTDSDFRLIGALRTFCGARGENRALSLWLRSDRPLSGLTSLRTILDLDAVQLRVTKAVPADDKARSAIEALAPAPARIAPVAPGSIPPPPKSSTRPPPAATSSFTIGHTRGLAPQAVLASPSAFATHAAFLGSSGSGKTTLALAIIEHVLRQGVPVLMIDRKGDLCTYAREEFWESPAADLESAELRRGLRESVQVNVYTPGEPRGRSLTLPVVPSGLGELPPHERGIAARHAASALGAMMGYKKSSKSDETRLGILGKAIELVGRVSGSQSLGITHLVNVLDDEDPELVALVGKLDTKHFKALVEGLETLRLRYEHLLRDDGERLSPELLFGLDQPDRTRLSIISTKFLGDNAAIDFWVSRLLGDLSRWASRSPSQTQSLQAVLFLDEADIYLPAQTKPATKEPMLDLLKRARSAGLGVFLATQSPGDLDYRCRDNIRTWFVGRVAEKTAVEKMKPLLSDCRVNVSAKLATAKVGEFFRLCEGDAVELKASLSLMKTVQVPEDEIVQLAEQRRA